jgi:hypothetical protein
LAIASAVLAATTLAGQVSGTQTPAPPQSNSTPPQPKPAARPESTGSVGSKGIAVGEVKLFDERLLTAMVESLETQLATLHLIDQASLASAIGRLQGANISTSSLGIAVTGLPTAKVGTETTAGSKLTSGSEIATSGSSDLTTVTKTTTGASGTSTETSTQGVEKSGTTGKETSGSEATEGAKRTTEMPSVAPTIPAAPTGTSLYSTGPAVGLASQDILTEQMNLSYQILNLRLLLSRALSDRYLSQDIEWASSGESGFQTVKAQTVLGFQISLDARHSYKDAVAEIEVSLSNGQWIQEPKITELKAFNQTDAVKQQVAALEINRALCHPSGGVSLVSLLPREKTYNVAAISRRAQSFGFGAVVQVVNVGFTASRSKETMYLVKDTDTVALQGPSTPEGAITFGWQFRPVLGRRVVEPGLRQVFATIALPVPATCGFVGQLEVKTHWRKYDRNTGAVKDVIEGSEETQKRPLAVPPFARLDNSLRPKITQLDWTDAGSGQIVAWATGEAFLHGTGVVLGDTVYGAGSAAYAKQGEARWRLTLPASKLALVNDAHLIGEYGTPTKIRMPALVGQSTPNPNLPVLDIVATNVTPSGADRSLVRIALRSASPHPYSPPEDKPIGVLIGTRLFGLSDAPIEILRDTNIAGAREPGTTNLSFRVPSDLVAANELVTVLEFFKGPNYRSTKKLSQLEVFSPTRIDVLAADDSRVGLGILGSGFTPQATIVANGQEFSVANGTLTLHGTSLLTFSVAPAVARAIRQVLVSQPGQRPKLLQYPSAAPPKPAVASVGTIVQGDSRWVAITGANLASIRTVLYDGKTPLQVEPDAGGSSLRVFVTADVTTTAGSKELELSNGAGDKVVCTLRVEPRS